MTRLKVAFIGCVEFSAAALGELLDHPDAEVVGVVTREASSFNADFRDLTPLAEARGIPVLHLKGRKQARLVEFLREVGPDVVYCFGWSFLLKEEVLAIPPRGTIGFHPAALPRNRGRHPLIWALVLGLRETASSFFFMDPEADTGDLLSQVPVAIEPGDDARVLYDRVTAAAIGQIREFTGALARGTESRIPQDGRESNHWRKRGRADGAIDFRMTADAICCLVRALARPYPGAHVDVGEGEVKVWRAEPGPPAPPNLEPGKVLAVEEGGAVVVKCWGGSVRLLEAGFTAPPEPGGYL